MALEFTYLQEQKDRSTDWVQRFKLAVVSADPKKWVPIMFPPEVVVQTEEDLDRIMEEGQALAMEFESVNPSEAIRMLDELLAETGGSFDATDLGVKRNPNEDWQ